MDAFLATRLSVLRHVRDAMAEIQDKQKEQADVKGRGCIDFYEVGDQVLLNAKSMDGVIQCKLNDREHRTPTPRRISTYAAKNIFNDANNALSLTIGLRVIRRGHVQTCA